MARTLLEMPLRILAALAFGGMFFLSGATLAYPGVLAVSGWIQSPPQFSWSTLLIAPGASFLLFMSLGGGVLCLISGTYITWRLLVRGFDTSEAGGATAASGAGYASSGYPEPKGFVYDDHDDGGG